MTAAVLITGAIFRAPEKKTSKGGKAYIKATVKTKAADGGFEFWNLLCFNETASAELLRLQDGDRVSVQGALGLEIYQGKISRSVFVNQVLALRQPPKPRREKAVATDTGTSEKPAPPFDDPIPF
jgi:hypothetical protein